MLSRTEELNCSVPATLATSLLSSYRVLNLIIGTPFLKPIRDNDFQEALYLTYQPWAARYPDHVFRNAWEKFVSDGRAAFPTKHDGETTHWAAMALRLIAQEFLEPKHGVMVVKLNKFGAWQQSVLSRISGVPVQAAAQFAATDTAYLSGTVTGMRGTRGIRSANPSFRDTPNRALWASPLLSPHDAIVEDYVEREGLHETHLHLSGSTHAEACWLKALLAPKAEAKEFTQVWAKTSDAATLRVQELARAINPDISPSVLYQQLRLAAKLRQWLVLAANGRLTPDQALPKSFDALASESSFDAPDLSHLLWTLSSGSNSQDEVSWISALLAQLQSQPSGVLDRMLLCYLVLQNQYYRLLVQSEEQFGFDQFQKITYTKLRDPTERNYLHRFQVMHGQQAHRSRTGYLEGRFAPKDTIRKNYGLLKDTLGGYWLYLSPETKPGEAPQNSPRTMSLLLEKLDDHFKNDTRDARARHRLALVAHFVKQAWSAEPAKKAGPYRFYKMRKDLNQSSATLLQTLKAYPRLSQWVRGIDAAANELHAPPEVFASCFRMCRQAGLTHRTYHVGEDFPHLLTGLRHMLDAMELLDLRDGNRIGHGTAMGISPQLWLDRMPNELLLSKGEWMLDLLGAWRLLRRLPDANKEVNRVECELAKSASFIFGRDVSCAALERAMALRHLSPHFVRASQNKGWFWQGASMNDLWRSEAKLVHEAKSHSQEDLDLLWTWQSDPALWKRSEAKHEVSAAFFDAQTLVRLQQVLMDEVSQRKVVIETLPSSNVRISQYQNFQEHHALRWMRVPSHVLPGDPEIMVSLGSDDPGIFAGDLNGEFYQLYAALRKEGIGDKPALDYLATVNERGRQYRFHDPMLF
jgi:adenosine deaminase